MAWFHSAILRSSSSSCWGLPNIRPQTPARRAIVMTSREVSAQARMASETEKKSGCWQTKGCERWWSLPFEAATGKPRCEQRCHKIRGDDVGPWGRATCISHKQTSRIALLRLVEIRPSWSSQLLITRLAAPALRSKHNSGRSKVSLGCASGGYGSWRAVAGARETGERVVGGCVLDA